MLGKGLRQTLIKAMLAAWMLVSGPPGRFQGIGKLSIDLELRRGLHCLQVIP